jgi:hypothetical protein
VRKKGKEGFKRPESSLVASGTVSTGKSYLPQEILLTSLEKISGRKMAFYLQKVVMFVCIIKS